MWKFLLLLLIIISGCVWPATSEISEQESSQNGGEKLADLSGKKVLMVIAPTGFKDEEYFTPKSILKGYGAEVETASTKKTATSVAGEEVTTDLLLADAKKGYDAIVFVGGPGASIYFNDKKAQSLAKEMLAEGKIVAAICIAPSTLANAGILKGKKATAFPSEQGNLESKGAKYTGDAVTQDGKIITAKNPAAAEEFGEKIGSALA